MSKITKSYSKEGAVLKLRELLTMAEETVEANGASTHIGMKARAKRDAYQVSLRIVEAIDPNWKDPE